MRGKVIIVFVLIIIAAGLFATFSSVKEDEKDLQKVEVSKLEGEAWPQNDFTRHLPRPTHGSLHIVALGRSSMQFEVSGYELKDYEEYIEIAKTAGFNLRTSTSSGFTGYNEDGYMISIKLIGNKLKVAVS